MKMANCHAPTCTLFQHLVTVSRTFTTIQYTEDISQKSQGKRPRKLFQSPSSSSQMFLRGIVCPRHESTIPVGTIVCDGESHQAKRSDFQKFEFFQRRNSESQMLSRLLFIPYLCRRLNNADCRLTREVPILKA
jgi:hypothetical protein